MRSCDTPWPLQFLAVVVGMTIMIVGLILLFSASRWERTTVKQPVPEPRMIYLEMRQYNVVGLDETLYVLRYFDTVEYRTVEVKAYSWPAISKVREVMK